MTEIPDLQIESTTEVFLGTPHNVVLFNDEVHDAIDVSSQIIKATGYSQEKAILIMLEAHSTGRAIVWTGHKERAEHIARVLEEIDLSVKLEQV